MGFIAILAGNEENLACILHMRLLVSLFEALSQIFQLSNHNNGVYPGDNLFDYLQRILNFVCVIAYLVVKL